MAKIYLISPSQIELEKFLPKLEMALKTGLVPVFQLRLKGYQQEQIKEIAIKIIAICRKYNVLFILNDSYQLALEINADGVHLGGEDGSIAIARNQSKGKNFIIGASCYDSRDIAASAAEEGADYLSFGTFYPSTTKNSKGKPTTEILKWAFEMTELPIVAIGGITDQNCQPLVKDGAEFVAVISYIWENPQGIEKALKNLHDALN